jgi:cullin-associated NEDD8-dissociated protein 1
LDDTVDSLKTIMQDVEVKDDTVKQDLERKGQLVPSVRLRTS